MSISMKVLKHKIIDQQEINWVCSLYKEGDGAEKNVKSIDMCIFLVI